MSTALLGYTGFVGGTLDRQHKFDDRYNSKDIGDIAGKSYDLVVCAAAPGTKWLANKNPEDDWTKISSLIDHLKTVAAESFILISTVDVYPDPVSVDESTAIDPETNTPYGKNRYLLEQFVSDTFKKHLIVRLPGLFGQGIKKNIIYDFIQDNEVKKINPKGRFQFYNLENLWNDIGTVRKTDLSLVNFATEPVTAAEVYKAAFDKPFDNPVESEPAIYDMWTLHADVFNQHGHYIQDKQSELKAIAEFITDQRDAL